MAKKKKAATKGLQHIEELVENTGKSAEKKGGSRTDGMPGSGRPATPTRTRNLAYTQSRPLRMDEYEGAGGKLRYGAANVKFAGDTIGSGEDFVEEYKRYKKGILGDDPPRLRKL